MEKFYQGSVLKKDTGNLIRNYTVYKDDKHLVWELTQCKFALFDIKDFDLLIQREWRAAASRNGFYAVSGRGFLTFAHNLIAGELPEGITVDHKSMDGLDNRRSNLRLATYQQQMLNRGSNGYSGYRGVTERKKDGKWRAECRVDKEHIHIGYFEDRASAAYAWDNFMYKKFKNHNPLLNLEINGICGEPTLNFIHFNFPEILDL